MATYRSNYENYYTDKQGSYTAIGAIVPTLANRHTTSITETGYTAPPNQSINPAHYTQKGFLYCDGVSYDINDYPALYDIIKNTYNDDTDVNSLTNPINNNSILFTDNGTAGSFYRTFVDGGNLYAEVYQKSYTPPGSGLTYKQRALPNNCEVTFVGGMGAMPGGGIFTPDTPKVLEYNSSYQNLKTSGQDTTVHRFIVGTATETVDVNWSISSSTLIQTQDTYPILPVEYYGTVPKNDPTSFNTTGYDEYTDAKNWTPQLSWSGLTGLPSSVTVDTWEIYLQDMSSANQIQWHIKNIPATTTSINANAPSLPAGATIVKNTVDRAATPRPLASSPNEWVTTTGYSGPQPDTNMKNIYRFNVIARLSNGQVCIEHLDFTAGTSNTTSSINNTGNITWSNFLAASTGNPIDKTLGFDDDITAGRSAGAGGLVFDPPTDISYNFKVEIYDPSGNGNTRSRVWSDANTQGAWVNHGAGWTTIAQTTEANDGSRPTGTLHKLEAVRYDNAANNAGWAAVRIDGEFRLIDVRPEPLESSPHYESMFTVMGLAGGVSSSTFNQDWTSFGAYTETAGGVRQSPVGMSISVAGTGYTTATGVATTGGTGTGLTVDTTITNGAITAVAVNNPGTGYAVGNIITVTGGNSDARLLVTNVQNVISGHPKVRVRKVYNAADYPQLLGKFKVPDYRDRKLIGMGEGVAGAGTPLVEARSSASVGDTGGKWILPKTVIDDPAEFFTISDVVTSGYASINTQIQAYLTGSKKITIGPMEEYFFNRPPEHDHQLLHSSIDETYPASMGGMDRFSTGYSNIKGAILDFEPATSDGEALGHAHGLLDSRPVNSAMTTYGNSAGIGDRQEKFSGGTLSSAFGNANLPTYSDQQNNALPNLNSYYPVINAFDGNSGTYCDMTMEANANWSMLTFGTPIANVTKIVIGYDGAAHVGYNTGNLNTSVTGTGSRQTITIHNGSATTINNLYFVTQGTPLAGSGTGYARLYDVKMTVGGTETELKQEGTGCYEYSITEPPNVPTDSVSSDGTTVTITTDTEHGLVVGDWVVVSGAGFTGEAAKYNGTFQVISDNWNAQRISYTPTDAPASGTAASSNTVIREAAGYFQDVTDTPSPNVWSVDALPVVIGGKPIFSNDPDQYGDPLWTQTITSANSFTQSFNSSDDVRGYFFVMRAPGGGGATSSNDGGNGGNASVNFTLNVGGSPVTYTVTLQGGRGGTKGETTGAGGSGGVVTITSTDGNPTALLNDDRVTFSVNAQGNGGASGGSANEATPAGGIGGTPDDPNDGKGGNGSYTTTPASGNFYEPASGSYTSNGSYNAAADNRIPAQSSIDYIELEAIGGAGGHGAKNLQGNCPTPGSTQDGYGGDRGKGRKITGITGASNGTNPTPQFATNFSWEIGGEGADGRNDHTGTTGESSTSGASGAGNSNGGNGGSGAWGNGSSGGAGGGATGIRIPGASWLLGAGGGGGAGAGGGGYNGAGWTDLCWNGGNGRDPAQSNYIATAIAPSGFSSSQNGGSSGCTAGGGGGGGGGFGGGAGEGGAGGQAGAGHVNTGSGDGGYAGRSAANSQFLTNVPANSYEGTDAGGSVRFRVFYTGNSVNKSGGGGGAGAEVVFSITGTTADIQSQVSGTLGSYGSAGAGGSPIAAENGADGYVYVRALPIQEGGQQVLDYTTPAGRVYSVPGFNTNTENWANVGTGSTSTLADIWHTSSTDVSRIVPANGTFPAMGNHSSVPAGHPTSNFFRFTGEGDRWLRMGPLDLTSAEQLVFSVIKGNGTNGGAAPEEALELQYNTDVDSSSYTNIQQIATSSDGTTGGYFNKTITLDANNPARTTGVYLLVKQTRPSNSGDNANNNEDEWGISQFGIIYGPVTTRVFVPAVSAFLPGNEGTCGPDTGINEIRKEITAGDSNIRFTDGTFTLSSSTPVSVSVTATPKEEISLLTRYHRAKYLIKAF